MGSTVKSIFHSHALKVAAVTCALLLGQTVTAQDSNISALLHTENPPTVQPLPIHGMIFAEKQGRVKIASGNGRFIFNGVMHDRWAGRDVLTLDDAIRAFNYIEMKGIGVDLVDALKPYRYGAGKKDIVIFIDPYCSACSKLLTDMPVDSQKYTFNLIPIAVLGEESKKRVKNLACAKDQDAARLQLLTKQYRDLDEVETCSPDLMSYRMFTGQILGIKGIPFMIRNDGLVSRGNPPLGVLAWLEG